MRTCLLPCLLSVMLASTPVAAQDATDAARALARDAIIVDTHIDAPGILSSRWADLGVEAPDREFDYPRAREGGLDVAWMAIYTSARQDDNGTARQAAHAQIDSVEALVQRHPDKFAILTSPRDIERLRQGGRVLLPLTMENAGPLEGDLSQLQVFFDRGIRYITLAHSAANRLSDSSYGVERKWNGLSGFGREVVAEMNRLGIIVDVSHISDAAAEQVIALSTTPVIASHSAFRHFTPGFERNISDELAKAVAAGGGVIQIPFGTAFVDPRAAEVLQARFRARAEFDQRNAARVAAGEPPEDRAAFEEAFNRENPAPTETPLSSVLDQIDYGVQLVGIDHLGIGSDFDGVGGELAEGLRSVADFPNLVAGLQARGYSDADIRKLLGENLLRVWHAVEDGAEAR
ncbi:membrane dipeptidase [Luteimonas aestuarii]|uniref:Membrane dipeptidase n=1 Tax=Luteimonas aestuarii TaxID=453837 RepID=A0A4R5TVF0_9GAMM|nr:dipeptidase [Luteimonas aestuarii]TDK25077.1 membrane dipeptidase [Luteimonas aestuarii]